MAMKNQDAEAKIASLKEELEKLRNENHNLKRRVKRMEERKESDKAERLRARAERNNRTEEVTREGTDDIKKKLKAAGLNDRTSEVMAWAVFGDTGTKKK